MLNFSHFMRFSRCKCSMHYGAFDPNIILYHIPLPVSCIKCEETPYFRAFAGFSSMSLRMSFFIFLSSVSVARSLADEHTR